MCNHQIKLQQMFWVVLTQRWELSFISSVVLFEWNLITNINSMCLYSCQSYNTRKLSTQNVSKEAAIKNRDLLNTKCPAQWAKQRTHTCNRKIKIWNQYFLFLIVFQCLAATVLSDTSLKLNWADGQRPIPEVNFTNIFRTVCAWHTE